MTPDPTEMDFCGCHGTPDHRAWNLCGDAQMKNTMMDLKINSSACYKGFIGMVSSGTSGYIRFLPQVEAWVEAIAEKFGENNSDKFDELNAIRLQVQSDIPKS